MKLGSSMRRRRSRERGAGGLTRFLALGLVLLALGFAGGYFLATEAFFPAPEPPEELSEIPELRGSSQGDAEGRIRDAGLILAGVDSLAHPTLESGAVVGQSPLPGQLAEPGDSVRLTVSLGPENRPVPDVYRVRGDRARAVLEATGFRVEVDTVESERPRGTVLGLEPEPGTELRLPGEVRLTLSRGPRRIAMPLLVGLTEEEAVSRLDSLGLAVADVATRFHFGLDQGIVLDQEPDAGTMLERGTAVSIVVGSRGSAGNIPQSKTVELAGIPGRSRLHHARLQ